MTFAEEIRHVINKHNREGQSNTPDLILANYLEACLIAFENAVQQREYWYGRDPGRWPREFSDGALEESERTRWIISTGNGGMKMPSCRKCDDPKEDTDFAIISHSGNRRHVCRKCRSRRNREVVKSSPARQTSERAAVRKWFSEHPDYDIKKRYGITWEKYDDLLRQQNGNCAICGNPPSPRSRRKRLCVDHCHATKRIRGLLCGLCNIMLGRLKDDPNKFLRAIRYLEGVPYADL